MKIRDLIISYLLLAIFWFLGVSALNSVWLITTIIAITLPLVFLFIKSEKHFQKLYSKGGQCILISFILALTGIFAWFAEYEGRYSHTPVAITDNIDTVTEIEKTLAENFPYGTVRELDGVKHIISLRTKNQNIADDAKIIIATNKNCDQTTLNFPVSYSYQKSKEKLVKSFSKELTNLIYRVENVADVIVDIKLIEHKDSEIHTFEPYIHLIISTEDNANKSEIIRIVKNIAFGTTRGLTDKNITIEFIREDCVNKEIGTKCEQK
ncbi:hypothetical protein IKL64_00385 [bacterium]|nr:hypothetical protein [bacterium]